MKTETIRIGSIDAIIIGEASKDAFLFVHGHGGNKEEALAFAEHAVPKGYQVLGIDLPTMALPWNVLELMNEVKSWLRDRYETVSLIMEGGEHWFHTPEQLAFMARWEADCLGLRDVVNSGIIRCQLSVEGDSCS